MILVVDDEKAVRDVTSRILSINGYRVITARNGAEALTAFAHNEAEVKLIVMDLLMPAMDGASTVKVLQKYNSRVPVVIVSGMVNPAQEAVLREQNVQAILPKPFTAEKLLSVIHDSLASN
jgi:CheY-like chemotaxis protein